MVSSSPPPAELPELPLVLRPRRTRAVLLGTGAAGLVVLTVIAVALPVGGMVDRVSIVATGLLILGVLALLSRPSVTADQDGVTVVNLTTRRRLEWAEIVRVNLRSGDPWAHLDLADGTSLPAMGIQPGGGRQQAVEAARALRALVEAHGA
ncbi:PH domain-containing protein [Streptomyces thermolineatus]|uniref:PH domain-containing protein n=1 Tax=Streptomyces thermolineatus TaxID=44033 RepID=UPI00384E6D40